MANLRIAVIFDNFGPYHIARLAAAAKYCTLLAIEVTSVSVKYEWLPAGDTPFERKTLFHACRGEKKDTQELIKRLEACLADFSPDVVTIPGWDFLVSTRALRWAVQEGVQVVLMSESQEIDFQRGVVKEWVKRHFLTLCQAALVGGVRHQDYLERLGMQAGHIRLGYDVVDNTYFETGADEARKMVANLRREYGLPEQYFLASARFLPKKNLQRLIFAYADYWRTVTGQSAGTDAYRHLVVLGDGELRADLEALIDELGLCDFVHMPGFKQYSELPVYYGLASAFIHPSTTEQWGLVVNEAMASGLPVMVSERCGCAVDLIQNGRNGFTFNPDDQSEITRLMLQLALTDSNLAAMGQESRAIIKHWSPDLFGVNLVSVAELAMAQPRASQASITDNLILAAMTRRQGRR